jgi:hypothetical protein
MSNKERTTANIRPAFVRPVYLCQINLEMWFYAKEKNIGEKSASGMQKKTTDGWLSL